MSKELKLLIFSTAICAMAFIATNFNLVVLAAYMIWSFAYIRMIARIEMFGSKD